MGKLALAGVRVCKNRKRFFAVTKGVEMEGEREEGEAAGVGGWIRLKCAKCGRNWWGGCFFGDFC